ncbi:MAG TPA: oligosaccharide flippase family protein [Trueperaceae bacterium]|nr:oligosaccharide flippase family protein [Trueperaceae bacterium]
MSRLRNVGLLAAGTAVAQLVSFGVSPILSRIYQPAEFGLLGVFVGIAAVASVVVSLRLDLAVVVPESESDAMDVVTVGVLAVAGMTALTTVLIVLFGDALATALGEPELTPLLAYLPLYLGATGVFSMFNYWSTRNSRFAPLAIFESLRAITVAGIQLGMGLLRKGVKGLVLGQVVGPIVLVLGILSVSARREPAMFRRKVSFSRAKEIVARFSNFIIYGTPQALVNSINQSLPVLVLTVTFNAGIAGYYLMAHRLIAAPISLLGRSTRQVIYPQLSRAMAAGTAFPTAIRTTFLLAAVTVLPVILVILAGPSLFAWVLGAEWRTSGEFARFLVVWLAVAFINIPSVSLIPLLEMQRWHAIYEIFYLIARFLALVLGSRGGDPLAGIMWFAIVGIAFNLVLIYVPLRRLRRRMAHAG